MFSPGAIPAIASLPLDLLTPLLAQLPLTSIFALSATCRSLRNFITDPVFLNYVLKEAIVRGSLRWICPVATIPRSENNRARKVLIQWRSQYQQKANKTSGGKRADDSDSEDETPLAQLSKSKTADRAEDEEGSEDESEDDGDEDDGNDEPDEGGEDPTAMLTSPDFPRLSFIRACWDSDFMMNRKRLWGQVKRFDVLWRNYRTNGWRHPRFYSTAEVGESEEED